jgi:hypothetical protein
LAIAISKPVAMGDIAYMHEDEGRLTLLITEKAE